MQLEGAQHFMGFGDTDDEEELKRRKINLKLSADIMGPWYSKVHNTKIDKVKDISKAVLWERAEFEGLLNSLMRELVTMECGTDGKRLDGEGHELNSSEIEIVSLKEEK